MQFRARTRYAKFKEGDALETQADDETLLSILVALFPDTAFSREHLPVLFREAREARTANARFAFDDETQTDRQLPKSFLIGFNRRETCDQIAFTVGSAARVELAVNDHRRERPRSPIRQLPDRSDIVMSIDDEAVRACAALAEDDRIAAPDFEDARARA